MSTYARQLHRASVLVWVLPFMNTLASYFSWPARCSNHKVNHNQNLTLCENRILPNLTRKRPVFSMSSRK